MSNRDRHPVSKPCGSPREVILRRASTLALLSLVVLSGCYNLRSSSGGAQAEFTPPCQVRTDNVALPPGYRIEIIATGLTFPTAVAFDAEGVPHVVEAGFSYGEVWTSPRLLRVATNGSVIPIALELNELATNDLVSRFYRGRAAQVIGAAYLSVFPR